jgi:hypothetical protein
MSNSILLNPKHWRDRAEKTRAKPRSRPDLWQRRHAPIARHGHPGQAYRTGLALAERLCRAADRIDPA